MDTNEEDVMYLSHSKVEKIPEISSKVRRVILNRNKIKEMEFLFHENIEDLDLNDNEIKNINGLENLPNLKILDLSFNLITQISNISLTHLRELYLISNDIEKIENLENLPNLIKLDLACNSIKKLENLINLPLLEELYLGNNYISKVENIEELKNLKVLALQNNSLEFVDCINIPVNVHSLLLCENFELSVVTNCNHLKFLKYLEIDKTQVKKENLNISRSVDIIS
ncbi:regulatory subunit of protein phosphatase 1 [Hamiltosporidium tvaerminnensis]|uniref:Regulatory subunit of protein phosphatase 1 n=2 Tax=Hamiltosporidium TaxID=1176354 RepID=A0A4Q9KXX8_9MICR|nr:protein phosphatase regulatory subunit Sds22 [Hamiltosporidium tvaerminnensis]TBT98281.1 regulatory subunit of protein phosphatase 1 [Hamiltosporidium magnivora]TBT99826.1 regulatory subunit of protein phosphatase 1 [Hamiltosporidium tvaerminnensis]TBU11207.1 regulatory subunit of protein phosphatase 1 [Hamiltosporidium tvaerminnensis]TBU11792.1 regulatory subunit of protein phosphatase 1 [Hamiltosporidium tvaerminnensis]